MTRTKSSDPANDFVTVLQECEEIAASASCAALLAQIYGLVRQQEQTAHSLAEVILQLHACVSDRHRPASEL